MHTYTYALLLSSSGRTSLEQASLKIAHGFLAQGHMSENREPQTDARLNQAVPNVRLP